MEWSSSPPLIDNVVLTGYSSLVRKGEIPFEDYVNGIREYIKLNPTQFYQSSRSGLPKFRYSPDVVRPYRARHGWLSVRSRSQPTVKGFFQLKNSVLRVQANCIRNQKANYGLALDYDGYKRVVIKSDNFIDETLSGVGYDQLMLDNLEAMPDYWSIDGMVHSGLMNSGLEVPVIQGQEVLHDNFVVKHVEIAKDYVFDENIAQNTMNNVIRFFVNQGKELACQMKMAYNIHSDPRFQSNSIICKMHNHRGRIKIYAKAKDRIRLEIMVEGEDLRKRGGMNVAKVIGTRWKPGTIWKTFVDPVYESFPMEGILKNDIDITDDLFELVLKVSGMGESEAQFWDVINRRGYALKHEVPRRYTRRGRWPIVSAVNISGQHYYRLDSALIDEYRAKKKNVKVEMTEKAVETPVVSSVNT